MLTAVVYVVEKKAVGTAFGVVGCAIGLSECVMPFVNVAVIDNDDDLAKSYKNLTLLYVFIAFTPFLFALFILFADFHQMDERL